MANSSRLEGTSKRIVRSSVMRVFDLLSGIAISFFFMPFLVHALGDDWYGIWTIIGSLTATYYLLDFGLASAVTRYITYSIARGEGRAANTIINTSLLIYSALALFVLAVTLIAASAAVPALVGADMVAPVQLAFVLVGTTLAAEFPFKAFSGIVGAYMRYDLLAWSHICARLLNVGVSVTLLSKGYGIVALAAVGLAASVLQNLFFAWLAKYLFREMKLSPALISKERAKTLFGYGSWAFVINVAQMVRTKIDAVVIGAMLTASHVTHYFIGARLAELVFALLLQATNLGLPLLTRFHGEENHRALRDAVMLMTKINLVLGVLAAGLLLLVGDAFIDRWMGPEYEVAYPVAVILLGGILVQLTANPLDSALYAISKHRALALIALGEVVANLTLSIWLLSLYGVIGVAIGTALPLLVTRGVLLPSYACKQIGISLRRYGSAVAVSAAFPAVYIVTALLLFGRSNAGAGYLDIVAYATVLAPPYLAGAYFLVFNRQERSLIVSALYTALGKDEHRDGEAIGQRSQGEAT